MPKVKKDTLRWILHNSKSALVQIVCLAAIGVVLSFVSTEFAMASMRLLDSATGQGGSFLNCAAFIAFLVAVQLLFQVLYTLLDVRVRARFKNSMQSKLFRTILTRNYGDVEKYHSGELINRLTADISVINTNLIDTVPAVFTLVSSVAFSFFAMLRLDMQLALICLTLGPVVLLCSFVYGRRMKPLHKKCLESDGNTRSFMQECIQNIIAVKSFCRELKAVKFASKLQYENYKLNMKRGYISVAVNIVYYLALTAAFYFAVAWCAYKIQIGVMTIGTFTAIIQLVGSIQSPFREISGVIPNFYATCASAERIMEIEKLGSDISNESEICDILPEKFEKIEAKNLSFSYGDKKVLSDVSFCINRSETAVIRGDSGIGKSTLLKIMLGILTASHGKIEVSGGGMAQNISAATRSLFSYVPQGNMILSGTILQNIAFMDENADRNKVEDAAKKACIWDYVSSLPDGFNTVLGEKGLGLSEGQVQRIAIARAFFCSAPIILLDEATSALDEPTEMRILDNIKKMKNTTCIIVTHRPAAETIADKIIELG